MGWAQLPKNLRGASKHPQTPQPHLWEQGFLHHTTDPSPWGCSWPPAPCSTPGHAAAPAPGDSEGTAITRGPEAAARIPRPCLPGVFSPQPCRVSDPVCTAVQPPRAPAWEAGKWCRAQTGVTALLLAPGRILPRCHRPQGTRGWLLWGWVLPLFPGWGFGVMPGSPVMSQTPNPTPCLGQNI